MADRELYSFALENVGEDLEGLLFLGSPSYVDEINAGIPAECFRELQSGYVREGDGRWPSNLKPNHRRARARAKAKTQGVPRAAVEADVVS